MMQASRARRALARLPLFVLLALPLAASAQSAGSADAELVRTLANELRRTAGLPGLSVAISQRGRIAFAEGFGYADIEGRRPVTPRTQFRTGSVAKVVTATALARLVEAGRIDLDAPVQRYVPSFPDSGGRITSRQLAGHLSGIAHYTNADRIEERFYPTMADALGVFSHVPPTAPPGERFNYSTHGYTLLSAAMEGAAGQPFLTLVEQEVLRPLGMRSTGPELHTVPRPDAAVLYSLTDSGPARVSRIENPSYKWAGGGMVSSPSDLVRLATAYTTGFLRPATVATAFQSQQDRSGRKTHVGLGWRNSWDMQRRRVVEHAGSMQGTRSVVSLFPDDRLAIAIMTNAEWSSLIEETAHVMALAYLAAPSPRPQPAGRYDVTATLVNGRNESSSLSGTLTLAKGRGALELTPAGRKTERHPLVYLKRDDVYALVRPDGIVHFTLTAAGDSVTGRAVGYGSPRADSPAASPPFLTVRGRRAR